MPAPGGKQNAAPNPKQAKRDEQKPSPTSAYRVMLTGAKGTIGSVVSEASLLAALSEHGAVFHLNMTASSTTMLLGPL